MSDATKQPKNRLAQITNTKPTVEQAVESIVGAIESLGPEAVVYSSVAALTTLADAADGVPAAVEAVAAVRSVTNDLKPYAFSGVAVNVLKILKKAIESKTTPVAATPDPSADETGPAA